jgi:hypothetical protein
MTTTFYLGTHMPNWLEKAGVPLFVSHNRLSKQTDLPRAAHPWALDSGGFTEIKKYGGWRISAEEYATSVRRCRDVIGYMDWAAPQDWMCEPWVIFGKNEHLGPKHKDYFHGTREARGIPDDGPDEDLTSAVRKHQHYTVTNYLELRTIAPDLPFIPVLQGWTLDDYLHCLDLYSEAGVNLAEEPVVGLGSVCRRQATSEIDLIASALHARGLNLHGFGVKTRGLAVYAPCLVSADSLAWSFRGRNVRPCTHGLNRLGRPSVSEANCLPFARAWRRRVLDVLAAPVQLGLPYGDAA